MSLMPGEDVSESTDSKNQVSRSMELFPSADVRKSDKTQVTIFYGGSVLVFDNFPEEKARDLMQLTSKGQNFGFMPPSVPAAIVTSVAAADHKGGSTFVTTSTNSNPAARPPSLPGTSCASVIWNYWHLSYSVWPFMTASCGVLGYCNKQK